MSSVIKGALLRSGKPHGLSLRISQVILFHHRYGTGDGTLFFGRLPGRDVFNNRADYENGDKHQ